MTSLAGSGEIDKAGPEKLDFVDRMRGLAILGVMLAHLSEVFATRIDLITFALGQFGVQLFFFASAFTLCRSHDQRRLEQHPVSNFYLRRLFRIAPMYWLGIAMYGAHQWLRGGVGDFTPVNVVANVLLVHGLVPGAINATVPGGWSIGVEMIFYALFPWVYPLLERQWQCRGRRSLLLAVVVAMAVSWIFETVFFALASPVLLDSGYSDYAFPVHLPVFVLGAAWYLAVFRKGHTPLPLMQAWVWLGLAGAGFVLCVWRAKLALPFALQAPLAALASGLIATILRRAPRPGGLLARIGRASYSLYVLHFAVMWYAMAHVTPLLHKDMLLEWLAFGPLFAVGLAVSIGMAALTKLLIEDPGIRAGRRFIAWREGYARQA